MSKRLFTAANGEVRCEWTIRLRGKAANLGSDDVAQCMRRKVVGDLCAQHAKMADRWSCNYCGGNDELPPDHCMDCSRPQDVKA